MDLEIVHPDGDNRPQWKSQIFGPLEDFRRLITQASGPYRLINWRQAPCFVRTDGDLGPYLRWVLVLDVLLESLERERGSVYAGKDHRAILVEALINYSGKAAAKTVSEDFDKRFGQAECPRQVEAYLDGPVFRALIELLNERLNQRYRPLSWDKVLRIDARIETTSTVSAETLKRYKQWLIHGFLPPVDELSGLMCEHYLLDPSDPDDARSVQLSQVIEQLENSGADQPIVNVYSRDNWTGLRAFATELMVRLARSHPLAARPALIYVRLSRGGAAGELPSPRPVVRVLEGAFRIEHEDGVTSDHSVVDWARDLEALRQALALHPCTIVLDGVPNAYGPLSSLFDMIRNTHWDEMIRILAQPHAQTIRQTGRTLQSRFLVLSAEPVTSLRAWRADSHALAPPSEVVPISSLLLSPESFDGRIEAARTLLGAQRSTSGLRELYGLKAAHLSLLSELTGRTANFGETELAIVSLFKVEDLDALPAVLAEGAGHATATPASQPPRDWRRCLLAHRLGQLRTRDPIGVLALNFIAASINGMRLSTLARCMRHLVDMVVPRLAPEDANRMRRALERFMEPPADNKTAAATLAKRFPAILVDGVDESMEGVLARHRRFEFQVLPSDGDEPADDRLAAALLDIRHEEMRALLIAEMIDSDRDDVPEARRAEWQLINWILAEESLRQSTVLQRNLDASQLDSPYVHRRTVQAIYHGLLSHRYGADPAHEVMVWNVPQAFALPTEPLKRFRFLYAFLYRRSVEAAPAWLLARGHARPKLKLAILSLFASPAWAVRLLANAYRVTPEADASLVFGALDSPFSERSLISSRSWIFRDPDLHLDVLEALARAAHDAGRPDLVRRLVRTIDAEMRSTQPRLWSIEDEGAEGAGRTFQKLLIDAELARNQPQRAFELCEQQLAGLRFDRSALERLMGMAVKDRDPVAWNTGDKHRLDVELSDEAATLLRRGWSRRERIAIADLLFRVGELLAIQADDLPLHPGDVTERQAAFAAFLQAYAAYYVADRMRSGLDDMADGRVWPLVSSRPMRYYVRVALKLAKLVPYPAQRPTRDDDRLAFYIHARVRMDVHARHLQRLPRERVAMLLLQAAAARVWAELVNRASGSGEELSALHDSLAYVDAAERLAIGIGYPIPVLYRLAFERVKTLRRMADRLAADPANWLKAQHFENLAQRDLDVLRRLCSGSSFWGRLVERQRPKRPDGWMPLKQLAASAQPTAEQEGLSGRGSAQRKSARRRGPPAQRKDT